MTQSHFILICMFLLCVFSPSSHVFLLFLLLQYEKSLLEKCMELTNITER